MDNKEEKPKTEKKGKYVVKDGEGNIISQNMPKEFEDMIDLIFQEAKEKSKKARKNGLKHCILQMILRDVATSLFFYYPI